MTFSIIIPTYNRADKILRAIRSVLFQDYPRDDYELIVVDDGSTDNTKEILKVYEKNYNIRVYNMEENKGRLTTRNIGMDIATGDWICWLDSDDAYAPTYLKTLKEAIGKYPEYSIFNFGAIVYDEQNFRSYLRDTFMPGVRGDGGGHDVFKSGGIGTGSFIFRRELLESVGKLPEARTPYGDDESLSALATKKWPEIGTLYGRTETGQWRPLGNPWGDDWLMFYILTRNNLSKPLNIHLYVQYIRK